MKRMVAMLLAGCLAFQTWIGNAKPVFGAQTASGSVDFGEAQAASESVDSGKAQSVLEVGVRSSAQFPFQGDVTVQIGRGSEVVESKDLKFEGSKASFAAARFEVSEGDYTVTVKSVQFADYTQDVKAQNGWKTKILISPSRIETGNEAAPGWIRVGDVNQDGVIDQTDIDGMMSKIREGSMEAAFDLNQDGKVDMADLQYIVQSIDEHRESTVEKLGIVQTIQQAEGATMEGNVNDFLNGTGALKLKPENANAQISAENPVGINFTLVEDTKKAVEIQGIVVHAPVTDEQGVISNEITEGEVIYTDAEGKETSVPFSAAAKPKQKKNRALFAANASNRAASISADVEADGSLVLDFGGQIAVKRVTIKITGTKKTEPLVNIAKVDFVNDMENRIPAPQMDIPTLGVPQSVDKGLIVSWNPQKNVTGYEVYISGPVKNQEEHETQIVRVSNITHTISSINDKPLLNFEKYKIKARSVNGDWSSPWSNEVIGEPKPTKLPAAPDNVSATGGYRTIEVSWKDMDDANGYMVYYKKTKDADTEYRPVIEGFTQVKEGTGKINATHYVIAGLEDEVEYSVYVVGWNDLGWGSPSLSASALTKLNVPPQLPNYKLLNTSNGEGAVSAHITAASYGGHGGAKMVGSALDTAEKSALGLVDNNFGSYWEKTDWDDGVAYPADNKGFTVTLDQDYKMNFITFASADEKAALQYARIGYWNTASTGKQNVGARLYRKLDSRNNPYYIIKLDQAITANKVNICLGRDSVRASMMVGEIHFHYYDSLEDDIMGLYTDEMHATLRADVTESVIQALEARLELVDEASGEKHPLYNELTLELKTAREILNSNLACAYEVENQITGSKDGHLGFGGLNSWQPVGKTVYAGESLLVYVGHNTKRTGDKASLQLVFTQQHAEAATLSKAVSLKVGRNEITVPQIVSKEFERGGQLYVAYTGNNANDKYAVRISGGSDIPVLSVYGKTQEQRMAAISAYVKELEQYVGTIEAGHAAKHTGTKNVDYPYDQQNCILNTTDIMMREMMYSVPATQVWAGIKNAEDKAVKLDLALKAMEKTMTLFYQHKGLSDNAGTVRGNNAWPAQHLNIRYMRMFAGAFMYASGNHIGVEWGSTLLASAPNDWSGFGWGVAHEIGHDINQGAYAVAEITNNYFAQLLTKVPGKTRFTYKNVYDKVTSNTIGRSPNVATQLALYWQLHIAYDNNKDDRHIYDNYEDQFNNLFFARVDTYSRNPKMAPQEGLTLDGGSEQNIMRFACAAANKNILPFFVRWGMQPDEKTTAYAAKYGEAETKALYYVNDDARDYRVDHPNEEGTIKDQDAVTTATVNAAGNQAEITIATDRSAELMLGYEISRSMISNGKKSTQVIGFAPIDTADSTVFVDSISSINNRVMEYEVRAVDKYLNYSNVKTAGSVKIQTDGVLNKSEWTVETTMTSADDTVIEPDGEDPDSGYEAEDPAGVEAKKVNSITRILDNDRTAAGTYNGVSGGAASITIDMRKTEEVTALKYQGSAVASAAVEVSPDGENWTKVKENVSLAANAEQTVWFDSVNEEDRKNWIGTYDAKYVRLTLSQAGSISIQEIEICGPTGDNLEFMATEEGQPAIGVLKEDFTYGEEAADVIPAGSLIFTGTYKGNPAYNIVALYDANGNVIGEKDGNVSAEQIILADVPEQGNLGETSDGTWVYYVRPDQWNLEAIRNTGFVRGELYRVDNALTLEGERIVSDTKLLEIPQELPDITLQGGKYEKLD